MDFSSPTRVIEFNCKQFMGERDVWGSISLIIRILWGFVKSFYMVTSNSPAFFRIQEQSWTESGATFCGIWIGGIVILWDLSKLWLFSEYNISGKNSLLLVKATPLLLPISHCTYSYPWTSLCLHHYQQWRNLQTPPPPPIELPQWPLYVERGGKQKIIHHIVCT